MLKCIKIKNLNSFGFYELIYLIFFPKKPKGYWKQNKKKKKKYTWFNFNIIFIFYFLLIFLFFIISINVFCKKGQRTQNLCKYYYVILSFNLSCPPILWGNEWKSFSIFFLFFLCVRKWIIIERKVLKKNSNIITQISTNTFAYNHITNHRSKFIQTYRVK